MKTQSTLPADKTIYCFFCAYKFDPDSDELDNINNGYWCSDCDSYNYLDKSAEKHKYTLILEDKASQNDRSAKIDVLLNKRLSPCRYPGGKSKISEYLYHKLNLKNTETLVSPYAGGAAVELAMLHSGVVKYLILNDYDFGIYSLFQLIKTHPQDLIHKITTHIPTHDDFFVSKNIIKSGYKNCDQFQAAWAMLLVNRLAYSGIFSANPLGGIKGSVKELLSRWNPTDLCKRIRLIHAMSHKITVENIDACELIEEKYWLPNTTLLIDPPYYNKGKNLYRYFYNEEDHRQLNELLESLYSGFPGADILLCYDNDIFIENLYHYPTIEKINRSFSA